MDNYTIAGKRWSEWHGMETYVILVCIMEIGTNAFDQTVRINHVPERRGQTFIGESEYAERLRRSSCFESKHSFNKFFHSTGWINMRIHVNSAATEWTAISGNEYAELSLQQTSQSF